MGGLKQLVPPSYALYSKGQQMKLESFAGLIARNV